jgi:hypothetical protein
LFALGYVSSSLYSKKSVSLSKTGKGVKMKPKITNKGTFKTHTSVTPEEIIAAGRTTAFGIKSGKNNETLKNVLKNSPKPEPFTEEEWDDLMKQLANDK